MDDAQTVDQSTNALTDEEDVTWAVVRAVADAKDVPPVELEPPLATVLDPEALERTVDSMGTGSGGQVVFTFGGCEVTVTGDGTVSVTE